MSFEKTKIGIAFVFVVLAMSITFFFSGHEQITGNVVGDSAETQDSGSSIRAIATYTYSFIKQETVKSQYGSDITTTYLADKRGNIYSTQPYQANIQLVSDTAKINQLKSTQEYWDAWSGKTQSQKRSLSGYFTNEEYQALLKDPAVTELYLDKADGPEQVKLNPTPIFTQDYSSTVADSRLIGEGMYSSGFNGIFGNQDVYEKDNKIYVNDFGSDTQVGTKDKDGVVHIDPKYSSKLGQLDGVKLETVPPQNTLTQTPKVTPKITVQPYNSEWDNVKYGDTSSSGQEFTQWVDQVYSNEYLKSSQYEDIEGYRWGLFSFLDKRNTGAEVRDMINQNNLDPGISAQLFPQQNTGDIPAGTETTQNDEVFNYADQSPVDNANPVDDNTDAGGAILDEDGNQLTNPEESGTDEGGGMFETDGTQPANPDEYDTDAGGGIFTTEGDQPTDIDEETTDDGGGIFNSDGTQTTDVESYVPDGVDPNQQICFLENTKITLSDYTTKNIQDVKKGDKVLSYDTENKKIVVGNVIDTFYHTDYSYLIVNGKMRVTPEHRMYINKEWKEINKAKVGDSLMGLDGEDVVITSLESVHASKGITVYNLKIYPYQDFFAEGVLVHNQGGSSFDIGSVPAGNPKPTTVLGSETLGSAFAPFTKDNWRAQWNKETPPPSYANPKKNNDQESGTTQLVDSLENKYDSEGAADFSELICQQVLDKYVTDYIKDKCRSDWESSESTDGEVPIEAVEEPMSGLNSSEPTNSCPANKTIGTLQYTISGGPIYKYDYSFTLLPCKKDIVYEVYMNPGHNSLYGETLLYGDVPTAKTASFDSKEIYTEMCISTDDVSFGISGTACFNPPKLPNDNLVYINEKCPPISDFDINNSMDIIFAADNYVNKDKFISDSEMGSASILSTAAFSNYQSKKGINFYAVDQLFYTSNLNSIRIKSNELCNYSDPISKLIIVLDPSTSTCVQNGFTIQVRPGFSFNMTKAQTATVNGIMSDFCKYLNPPDIINLQAAILTDDMTIPGTLLQFEFGISSQEYPVNYEVLLNNNSLIQSRLINNSIKKQTVNVPYPGTWQIQIKATDKSNKIAYSNMLTVSTNSTIIVDFSNLGTINLPINGSTAINLNSYVHDPMKETIKEWVHEPAFSNCIGFDPAAQITDGQVTINHIIEAPCQETVTFEVITNLDRRGSDTITINVG